METGGTRNNFQMRRWRNHGADGQDGLDSSAIQNLRLGAHIERSPSDAAFNVNYSIESSSDLENWTSEVNNTVSVDPTSADKMFLRLSTN